VKGWWLRLVHYARPEVRGLTFLGLAMLVAVALDTLAPWPLKLLVDNALAHEPLPAAAAWIGALPGAASPQGLVVWLAASSVLLFLGSRCLRIAQRYVENGVGNRMVYDLGADLFDHLQRLSLRFHGRRPRGDLVRRVTTDSRCVRELLIGVFLPIFSSVAALVMMFGVMWQLDRTLTLVALAAVVPVTAAIRYFSPSLTGRAYRQQEAEGELMSHAERTLTALPVVQSFGRDVDADRRFVSLARHSRKTYLSSIGVQIRFKVAVDSAIALGGAAILVLGGHKVLEGSLSIGSLLVFISYLASLYAPLQTLAQLSSGMAGAAANARRVIEVLESEEGVRDVAGAQPLPGRVRGEVCLQDVVFGYDPGRPVLSGVSLTVRPGETLALVGPTGAGKSTLVSLIPRFFDPWSGRVTLDGRDVRETTLASLRSQVSLVLQEPFLLPLSVAENVAYGRPGASREEISAAAQAANADAFIRRLPQGYDTVLGERGATLSGGEQQRLAIARALLKDAPVLILDEPTSALDAQTERLVLEALERLMQARTTLLIAHRLSTVRGADRIAVIEGGRLAELGTHSQLLSAGGVYRTYHELAAGSRLAPKVAAAGGTW
jgi:ATP-binding cassette subfamily B protein/subfamily B ATP-binding cassette protein MsbA